MLRVFTFLAAMVMAIPAAAQRLEVPFDTYCPPDTQAACFGAATVMGLNPDGDGFLAVRAGPETRYPMIGKLYNGDEVGTFDRRGDWHAISGRGMQGWVHGRWLGNFRP